MNAFMKINGCHQLNVNISNKERGWGGGGKGIENLKKQQYLYMLNEDVDRDIH